MSVLPTAAGRGLFRRLRRVGAMLPVVLLGPGSFIAGAEAQAPAKAPPAPPQAALSQSSATPPLAIGCPSLANLRLLLRQAGGDTVAASAVLADPKADHLSCTLLGRDRVNAVADRASLNGHDYDCVSVTGTSVCHWTVAGTVVPADPARPVRKAPPEKPRH